MCIHRYENVEHVNHSVCVHISVCYVLACVCNNGMRGVFVCVCVLMWTPKPLAASHLALGLRCASHFSGWWEHGGQWTLPCIPTLSGLIPSSTTLTVCISVNVPLWQAQSHRDISICCSLSCPHWPQSMVRPNDGHCLAPDRHPVIPLRHPFKHSFTCISRHLFSQIHQFWPFYLYFILNALSDLIFNILGFLFWFLIKILI